MSNISVIDLVI